MSRSSMARSIALLAVLSALAVGGWLWSRAGWEVSRLEDLSAGRREAFEVGLTEARQHIRAQRWTAARERLEACGEIFGKDPRVIALLGRVELGLRTRARRSPRSIEEEDEQVGRILEQADAALRLDPDCLDAHELRYDVLRSPTLRRFDPDGALDAGRERIRLDPENLDFRLGFVTWLLSGVRFHRGAAEGMPAFDSTIGLEIAQRDLEEILDDLPVGTDVYRQAAQALAVTQVRMGDFESAVQILNELDQPTLELDLLEQVLVARGYSLYRLGRFEAAARDLKGAMELNRSPSNAWLLRLVVVGMGKDPAEEIRAEDLFPFAPEEPGDPATLDLRFTEVAAALGVAKVDGAGPSAFADYDGDGDDDLIVAGCDTYTALYRNDGERFRDVTIESGLAQLESGFSTNLVDYDDDGDLDLYIARNGWSGNAPNILLRNDGNGKFTDVSAESGLDDGGCGFVSLWSDFDRDGRLDVFITNGVLKDGCTNRLYRNRGDGSFEDVTERAGLSESRRWETIGAAVGDYDRDGDPDLFVNGRGEAPNRLYANQGDGTFLDVAVKAGVEAIPHNGYVSFFLDYDNDALPDLLTTSLADWEATLAGFTRLVPPRTPEEMNRDVCRLYRNRGNGTFEEVTFEAGLMHPHGVMGANIGDLDNDGFVDLLYGTGSPNPMRLEPTILYRNNGNGTFTDRSRLAGIDHLGKGHGISLADFDGDGDLDIYAPQGGFNHGDLWANPFYRNESGSGNHWLHLDLVGTRSNRFAVGAQVTLRAGGGVQYREVTGGIGFGSTNSYPVEFGLGSAVEVEEVLIIWPSGFRQTLRQPPIDRLIRVVEAEEGWQEPRRPPGAARGN